MGNKKLLALGIPTYKRPDFAIKAIKNAVAMNVYDQIIVSSNSHEEKIDCLIKELDRKEITYHQQGSNVGMSLNYVEVIGLCDCKYLHIVSDEDYTNDKNTKELYSTLENNDEEVSVVILSVKDNDGALYRDASWQENRALKDICGDSGHIGSSIIKVSSWTEETFKEMHAYCTRKGDVYPTAAAAILSYVTGGPLLYFSQHIVEMGKNHTVSEMGGHNIYGFESRFNQFISMFILVDKVNLESKFKVYFYMFYFFSHHALRSAKIKYPDDNTVAISIKVFSDSCLSFKERSAACVVLTAFYMFRAYYFSRKVTRMLLEKIGLM